MTKVLICSMPKSGTYLVGKVLECLDFKDTGWHLSEGRYQDYGEVSLSEGRRNPGRVTKDVGFEKMIAKLPEDGFAVSHLAPSVVLPILQKYPSLKVVFLKRNILDIFVSFNHWYRSSGRWNPSVQIPFYNAKPRELRSFFKAHCSEFDRIRSASEWDAQGCCISISFEDISGQRGLEAQVLCVEKLISEVRFGCQVSPAKIIDEALDADSLTKSNRDRSDRDEYYDRKNWEELERRGMLELNEMLGYVNLR